MASVILIIEDIIVPCTEMGNSGGRGPGYVWRVRQGWAIMFFSIYSRSLVSTSSLSILKSIRRRRGIKSCCHYFDKSNCINFYS